MEKVSFLEQEAENDPQPMSEKSTAEKNLAEINVYKIETEESDGNKLENMQYNDIDDTSLFAPPPKL